jgi:hypothetical protein
VDDTYLGQGAMEFVNFPFFFNQPGHTGIIKAGTPLVQMIVLKRDNITKSPIKAKTRVLSEQDNKLIQHTRNRRSSHESLYKDTLRQDK